MKSRVTQTLERVGGRYAFSPWLLVLSAPFLITGLVATEISPSTAGLWWLYGLAGLISHIALGLAINVGKIMFFPRVSEAPFSPWLVLLIYFLSSQARAVAFSASLDFFALSNQTALVSRLATSGLLITLAFGFSSYSLESYRRYRDTREDLVHALVEAQSELEKQQAVSQSLRESLMARVDREVEAVNLSTLAALDDLEKRLRSGNDVRPELQSLLDHADQSWRTISHETWQQANVSIPRTTRTEFLRVLVANRPFSLTAIGLGGVFLYLLALGRSLEVGAGLGWSALWASTMMPLTFGVNFALSRQTRFPGTWMIVGVAVLGVAGIWLGAIPGLSVLGVLAALTVHFLAVGTSLLVGFGPALTRNRAAVLDALRSRLDESTIERLRAESEMVLLAQKVASRLHGTNRGYFLARVYALQRALDQGDTEEALISLDEVRRALSSGDVEKHPETQDSDLVAFLENWRGLVDITSNLHTAALPDELHPAVNTILIDAVNDAIRHGGADWIDISLETIPPHAVLTVVNNGRTVSGSSGGIGSKTLDRLASAGWSRNTDSLGFTRLVAKFSLEGASTKSTTN